MGHRLLACVLYGFVLIAIAGILLKVTEIFDLSQY